MSRSRPESNPQDAQRDGPAGSVDQDTDRWRPQHSRQRVPPGLYAPRPVEAHRSSDAQGGSTGTPRRRPERHDCPLDHGSGRGPPTKRWAPTGCPTMRRISTACLPTAFDRHGLALAGKHLNGLQDRFGQLWKCPVRAQQAGRRNRASGETPCMSITHCVLPPQLIGCICPGVLHRRMDLTRRFGE